MEADFSGYATKAGLKCSDGRTIMPEAFKNMDGQKVPLVWQHGHSEPGNVLGHAMLESRDDGVYAYAFFNGTDPANQAKSLVQHGDITALSIYANQLVERSKQVFHGVIRELSLVLSGANPGALIDNISIAHADGDVDTLEDEAIIYTGLTLEHEDKPVDTIEKTSDDTAEHASDPTVQQVYDTLNDEQKDAVNYLIGAAQEDAKAEVAEHADGSSDSGDKTVQEVYDSLTEEQKTVVHYMIGAALEEATSSSTVKQSDSTNENEGDITHMEGTDDMDTKEGTDEMTHNVFEQSGIPKKDGPALSHDQLKTIVDDAQRLGSLKESFLAHVVEYGIENIDYLFPDAKNVTSSPDVISRRMEWVQSIIGGAKHSPFARIKSTAVDITADEARAKGYVKATLKKEEVIKLLKRVTTPTTVYKKQKLDRDDIIDITDLDVVSWLKAEMRIMLDEELARAVLIGDGRDPESEDKVDESCLRPIAWDDEMYAHLVTVASNISGEAIVESILRARTYYKGTGTPTLYTTDSILTDMILLKDGMGRRLYPTETELAAALRVDKIVVVEVMESVPDLLGIVVNINDYTMGADRGGAISMFDDFDIDYNQYKYLIETRVSGALTKPKSAIVIKRVSGTLAAPTVPTYNPGTHTITIPTVAGVDYQIDDETVSPGPVVITETTEVVAVPQATYHFAHNIDTDWTYVYTA
jgi:hypothetical protein